MPTATSTDSTLCLNQSNHASIPEAGLVLEAGITTPVTPEQAEYLRTLGIAVQDDPEPEPQPSRARRAHQE